MRPIRVLLVDDSAAYLNAATQFLGGLVGVSVVGCASCAEQALQQMPELVPDLVMTDLIMPGMSGLAALPRFKQCAGAPKVVVVTLHNTDSYRRAAVDVEADGFIAKDNLVARLPDLLDCLFPGRQA